MEYINLQSCFLTSHADLLWLSYTIMYLNIFHSLTITIAPYQSHSNHKHKTFLAMNKYSSKLRHALDSLKIKKKIKMLSSRRRPCCHAKLKYNRLLLMKKGSNHCTGKLEMKYLWSRILHTRYMQTNTSKWNLKIRTPLQKLNS